MRGGASAADAPPVRGGARARGRQPSTRPQTLLGRRGARARPTSRPSGASPAAARPTRSAAAPAAARAAASRRGGMRHAARACGGVSRPVGTGGGGGETFLRLRVASESPSCTMFSTCFPRANRAFSFPRANRGFSFPRANRGFNPLLRRGAAGAENLGLCAGADSRALRADLDLHGRRDACRRPRGKARATARDATAGRDRAVRPGLPHDAAAAAKRHLTRPSHTARERTQGNNADRSRAEPSRAERARAGRAEQGAGPGAGPDLPLAAVLSAVGVYEHPCSCRSSSVAEALQLQISRSKQISRSRPPPAARSSARARAQGAEARGAGRGARGAERAHPCRRTARP